jgi:ankyrin repeat protein
VRNRTSVNKAINTGKDCDAKLAQNLYDAVTQKDINKLKKNIKKDDKINCIYDDGLKTKSIFALAIEKNQPEILKYLIEVGADVNLQNPATKETPLMTAAKFSHSIEMVEILVENGARINDADQEGKTPLMMAVNSAKSLEIIKYLVEIGANVHAKDVRGYTALDIANKQDVIDSMEMMLGREKAVKTAVNMRSDNYQKIVNILHSNSKN